MELHQSFSRGFTRGHFGGVNHQQLVDGRAPKKRGIRVGTVVEVGPNDIVIQMETLQKSSGIVALKPGDGVFFDSGRPDADEQGGRIFTIKTLKRLCVRAGFGEGDINLAVVMPGDIVWKTDDPAFRRRMEWSYSRDRVIRPTCLSACVYASIGAPLKITFSDDAGHAVEVSWDRPLALAQKHPLSLELVREQLGRLGGTPFRLVSVKAEKLDSVMAPKSVLNDLRRRAVESLLALRATESRRVIVESNALETLREEIRARPHPAPPKESLCILVRTMEQLSAVLDWTPLLPEYRPAMVYCDFRNPKLLAESVEQSRAAQVPVALATPCILKPGEEDKLLGPILNCTPDAFLVRNLGALGFLRQHAPRTQIIGDYSLNAANEITVNALMRMGVARVTSSCDLNWRQLSVMFDHSAPSSFEVVIHQHVAMFHMQHCVFANALSNGRDRHSCGCPCERHIFLLRDRNKAEHLVLSDAGCRNTVFNAVGQSALDYLKDMKKSGLRYFRIELLMEDASKTKALLRAL